jgi:hypothetical protein
MADIIFQADDGVSMALSESERAMLDEISIKPSTKTVPIVKPKTKVKFADPGMDAFINPAKMSESQQHHPQHQMMMDDDEYPPMEEDGEQQFEQGAPAQPSPGYRSIEDEKADLLNKLARLQKKGFSPNRKFGVHNDIEELRTEYKRITYGIEADQSVKFQRRMLMAFVTGLEFMNKRYDPFDVHLDGWSESMMENMDDYDTVFEDLYAKYRDKVSVAPEIRLIMMVGGSAMMFHLSNSMFKSMAPNMNQVLKQNPQLVKNMVDALNTAQKTPTNTNGPREMRGPGIDLGNLLGGFGVPLPVNSREPPPSTKPPVQDDQISDIVSMSGSEVGDTRDISLMGGGAKKRRRPASKKNEVTL